MFHEIIHKITQLQFWSIVTNKKIKEIHNSKKEAYPGNYAKIAKFGKAMDLPPIKCGYVSMKKRKNLRQNDWNFGVCVCAVAQFDFSTLNK